MTKTIDDKMREYAIQCHYHITVEKRVPEECQSQVELMATCIVGLMDKVAELEAIKIDWVDAVRPVKGGG